MFRSLIVELSWQTGLHNCSRKLTGFFIVRLLSSWPIFVYRLSCVETGANRKLHFVPLAAYNICSPSSKCEGASVFLSDVYSWVAIGERTFKTCEPIKEFAHYTFRAHWSVSGSFICFCFGFFYSWLSYRLNWRSWHGPNNTSVKYSV